MSGPAPRDAQKTPSRGPARTKLRRRLTIAASVAAGFTVVLFGADAALGAIAQERARCQTTDGMRVETDLATLPVTSGLATGWIGTAEASVPWHVMEDRVTATLPEGSELSLTGDSGLVVVQTSRMGQPVTATLRPAVGQSGTVELSLVGVSVAGREVPVELAQAFGGTDSLLSSLSGGDEFGLPFEVTSVEVGGEGLDLSMRLPLSALTSSGDGQGCPAPAP